LYTISEGVKEVRLINQWTRKLWSVAFLFLLSGVPALPSVVTLHFDELGVATSIGPAGLTVEGVTFTFAEDPLVVTPAGAAYGETSFPTTTYLTAPVLAGYDPGVLTLSFSTPSALVSFGAAYALTGNDVFEVRLFDQMGNPVETDEVPTSSIPACDPLGIDPCSLSEAFFSYGGIPISRAELDFSSAVGGGTPAAFAIDNLSFAAPDSSLAAPEPGTVGLLAAAFAVLMSTRFKGSGTRSSRGL
jgi:hypothetical protein